MSSQTSALRASAPDRRYAVDLISDAFFDDPAWSWAFSDPATRARDYREWWELFVSSALPHGNVWFSDDRSSVSVWLPPGVPELSEDAEARVEPLLRKRLDAARAELVLELLDLFDSHHPHDEPHYYLSLLATDPARRGRGTGLSLLERNLAAIDAEGTAAYLEASNEANVPLYERYGFAATGTFAVAGSPTVTTMWRPPRR